MSAKEINKVKIGFVPAHREFFDENWAVKMRERCIQSFTKIENVELIVPDENLTKKGLVRDEEDAQKVIQLFKEKNISGLVIGAMTFGDEISVLKVVDVFSERPILLFGTKEGPFTAGGNRLSDSFCGTLAISSGLYRRKIPFIFAGILFPEDKTFEKSVSNFIRVCTILKYFVGAKIGQVGPRPEPFETCIYNESAMIEQFGQRVIPITVIEVFDSANNLSDKDPKVQSSFREIVGRTDTSKVTRESLMKIAKLECALKRFATDNEISAMGIQCWTAMQKVYGISSCHAMGRLTDQGVMASCEVDIYGALTMLVQYLAGLKSTPPYFIDWTIKHQEKENVFLAWHCGNAPPSLVCEGCSVVLRSHSILGETVGLKRSMGTGEFQLKPGPVTICRLAEYDGKFKMLVTKGEIEKADQNLRGSWSWVRVPNLDLLYSKLVIEGFIHHASMIHGDFTRPIIDACRFLRIETIVV